MNIETERRKKEEKGCRKARERDKLERWRRDKRKERR